MPFRKERNYIWPEQKVGRVLRGEGRAGSDRRLGGGGGGGGVEGGWKGAGGGGGEGREGGDVFIATMVALAPASRIGSRGDNSRILPGL